MIATFHARNATRGRMLACAVREADSFLSRLLGLLGRRALGRGEGLWLRPCRAVHSIGMRFPIDVLFLDGTMTVVGACRPLRPNRVSAVFRNAAGVLELPAGTLASTGTRAGDTIELVPNDIGRELRRIVQAGCGINC